MIVLWLGCRCLPSVNIICGRIMIGLSLFSSVIKGTTIYGFFSKNIFSFPMLLKKIFWYFGGGKKKSDSEFLSYNLLLNSGKTQYVILLWLGLLLFSSVSKHNMWSYYDWVYCCCRPSVNTICGRIMTGFIVVVFRQ